MGKIDIMTKEYMFDNKRFADLRQEYIEEGFNAGRSEGFHAGRTEGFSIGKDAAVTEMVKKIFDRGISVEEIAEITEKSIEEVEAIRQ